MTRIFPYKIRENREVRKKVDRQKTFPTIGKCIRTISLLPDFFSALLFVRREDEGWPLHGFISVHVIVRENH